MRVRGGGRGAGAYLVEVAVAVVVVGVVMTFLLRSFHRLTGIKFPVPGLYFGLVFQRDINRTCVSHFSPGGVHSSHLLYPQPSSHPMSHDPHFLKGKKTKEQTRQRKWGEWRFFTSLLPPLENLLMWFL
ncbi:hypothetical protein E2C01_069577 [Portunus trituberculatus]|uniref:Uncharacterized protein n=1 Tax=Portunus trituberculatus TaxID=210409 RepID=A0A5B7HYX3_PORTR|nr:hypothetical protein [Portunus trituberculatus]